MCTPFSPSVFAGFHKCTAFALSPRWFLSDIPHSLRVTQVATAELPSTRNEHPSSLCILLPACFSQLLVLGSLPRTPLPRCCCKRCPAVCLHPMYPEPSRNHGIFLTSPCALQDAGPGCAKTLLPTSPILASLPHLCHQTPLSSLARIY